VWLGSNGSVYKKDKDDTYLVSNFIVIINEKLTVDDGKEKEVFFNITPICNMTDVLPSLIISAKDFRSSAWVSKYIGNKAILFRERDYEAVRVLALVAAKDAPDHKVTGCIGWLNTSKEEGELDYAYCYSGEV
jgi:hypothetical protein